MIRSVEISGAAENPYKIDLIRPDQNGLIVRDIKGLGAGKADLFFSKRASLDGDVFNGARKGTRNIQFELEFGNLLNPETGREITYDVMPLKEQVTLLFEKDNGTKYRIQGYAEANEESIFTREPGADISLLCDPYFSSISSGRQTLRMYALEPKLEFPLVNESVIPTIEMGEHIRNRHAELRYVGTIPNGVLIRFIFMDTAKNPSIINERTNQFMRIDTDKITAMTGYNVGAGDIVEINTVRGKKSVRLIRDGKRINIINALADISDWIQIRKGLNPISINAETGIFNFQTEIVYDSLYAGL